MRDDRRRHRKDQSGQRPGYAYVEQRAPRRNRGFDLDERPESSYRRKRNRNEVWQRRAHAVPPTGDVMPHLMRPEDRKHRERIDRAFSNTAEHEESHRE